MKKQICVGFLFVALSSSITQAEWFLKSKDSLGFGSTDNASLTSTNVTPDGFLRFSSFNSLLQDRMSYLGSLSYTSFATQKINDVLNWNLTASYDLKQSAQEGWDVYGSLLGQKYTEGAPETTEGGFDYIGLEGGAEYWQSISSRFEWGLGAGYRLQDYTQFQSRFDHSLFIFPDLKFQLSPKFLIKGNGGLTFLYSSMPDYSRSIFEMGGAVQYSLEKNWLLGAELLFRSSTFFNRTVATQTVINTHRGTTRAIGQDKENLSFAQIEFSGTYLISEYFSAKAALGFSQQSSLSGTQDYTEDHIIGSIIGAF